MDKFVIRSPSWKKLNYAQLVAKSRNNSVQQPQKKSTYVGASSDRSANGQQRHLAAVKDVHPPGKRSKILTEEDSRLLADTPAAGCGVGYAVNGTLVDENRPPLSEDCIENKLNHCNISDYLTSESSASLTNTEAPLIYDEQLQQDSGTPKNNHPMLARIQCDLNSPSATLRMRALRALKSPTKSAYTQFDVSHSEQIIITEEERRAPTAPRSIQDLMRDIVVYVEVRSGEDNRSAGVKKVISALGAQVNDKLLRGTSHVVFKDGLLSTYKKAKLWNIPVVSILWIEACKNQRYICDPKDFPISNIDRYENPELYEKFKRHKSMQPDSECNKRIRLKPATPKNSTPRTSALKKTASSNRTPGSSNNKNTDKLDGKKTEDRQNGNAIDSIISAIPFSSSEIYPTSPSIKYLNTANSNNNSPKSSMVHLSPFIDHHWDAKKKLDFQPTITNLNGNNVAPEIVNIPQRRTSILAQILQTSNLQGEETSTPGVEMTFNRNADDLPQVDGDVGQVCPSASSSRFSRKNSTDLKNTTNEDDEIVNDCATEVKRAKPTSRRRHSSVQSQDKIVIVKAPVENKSANNKEDFAASMTPNTRRRTRSMSATISPIASELPSAMRNGEVLPVIEEAAEKPDFPTNVEEECANTPSADNYTARQLTFRSEDLMPMDQSTLKIPLQNGGDRIENVGPSVPAMQCHNQIRRTLYSHQKMEISLSEDVSLKAPHKTSSGGCTLYMINSMEETLGVEATRTPITTTLPAKSLVDSKNTKTPLNPGLLDHSTPLSIMNSARKPERRRTLFDVTMDVISQNLQTINNSVSAPSVPYSTINEEVHRSSLETEAPVLKVNWNGVGSGEPAMLHMRDDVDKRLREESCFESGQNEANRDGAVRTKKRKLFQPNESQLPTLPPSTSSTAGKRRRTLSTLAHLHRDSEAVASKSNSNSTDCAQSTAGRKSLKGAIRRQSTDFELARLDKPLPIKRKKQVAAPTKNSSENVEDVQPMKVPLPILVCTNMHKQHIDVIRQAIAELGGFDLGHCVCARTTHVVSLEPRRTLNLLRGLIRGLWILDYKWVVESVRAGIWLTEEPYEMMDFSRAVEICRAERQAFGNMYKCELFTDIGPFYISMRCGPISRDNLRELIGLCGGKTVDHRKRAKYILGDLVRTYDDKIYVTPNWVLDSITQMQLQKLNRYDVNIKVRPSVQSQIQSQSQSQTMTGAQGPTLDQNLVEPKTQENDVQPQP